MTVIATDGRSMAGDGICCDSGGSITTLAMVKIRVLNDGSIVGVAGSAFDIDFIVDWMEQGGSPPKGLYEKGEFLRLMPDGKAMIYHYQGGCFEVALPYAIGCGSDFARMAMRLGKTPAEAVALTCELSVHCGGTITEHSLSPPPE